MRTLVHQREKQKLPFITVGVITALFAMFMIISAIKPAFAVDPAITGGSPIVGRTDVYIPVEDVQITGDVAGTTTVSVRVASGSLRMTTTTGLTFDGPTVGRTLTFDGTKTDLNTALATLQYRANTAGEVTLTATLGTPGTVYYPGNGHIYEVVPVEGGISWADAKLAAEARTREGAQGYLATITSQAENDYITARLVGDGWFGATDTAVEGEWRWVTGPEAGTQFWQGQGGGSVVNGEFSNWSTGEPNDSGSAEDCSQFYGNGSGWNDLACSGAGGTLGSYVVEYGAPGDMPIAPTEVSFTTTTTTPAPADVNLSTCEQFFNEFVDSNEHRYDNITLTQDLDCSGQTIYGMFTDFEYVYDVDSEQDVLQPLPFGGTFNGSGHTISNLVIEPRTDLAGNYRPSGFFGVTDPDVTIENLTLDNVTVSGVNCVGGIVGSAKALTMRNVHFTGSITATQDSGSGIGGLVGCMYSGSATASVEESSFTGTVLDSTSSASYTGGLVGRMEVTSGSNDVMSVTINDNTTNGTVFGRSSVGGLVGYIYAYEDNVTISVARNTSDTVIAKAGGFNTGGAIGYASLYAADFTVDDVFVVGDVTGNSYVGGLIGYLRSAGETSIHNVHLTNNVTGSYDYVGGLVGQIEHSNTDASTLEIYNVSTTGDVIGYYRVGGLIGGFFGYHIGSSRPLASIYQSSASGDITADAGYMVGGLVGVLNNLDISESFSTGNVSAPQDQSAGGLVGQSSYSLIKDSYARGSVTSQYSYGSVGGLIGNASSDNSIINSYSTAFVSVPGESSKQGGLLGQGGSNNSASLAYWDTQTSGQALSDLGIGKTTAQLKTRSTFTGWSFDGVWGLNPAQNDGYPCLQWVAGCIKDDDGDNISNIIEAAAPNSGDANNDGTADTLQGNVASFVNPVTGKYVSLATDPSCSVTSALVVGENDNTRSDDDYYYRQGMLDFALACDTTGFTTTVQQYYYGLTSVDDLVVRKYDPNTETYQTISSDDISLTTQSIAGQTVAVLTYDITDGGALDTDGEVNGEIVDPIGLASAGSPGAPNTGMQSQLPLIIMSTLLGTSMVAVGAFLGRRSLIKSRD